MICFNMTGALGAPKAIAVAGTMTDIVSDIALATAQVYHCQMDPMTRPIFKKMLQKAFSDEAPTWTEAVKVGANVVINQTIDMAELKRQAQELDNE